MQHHELESAITKGIIKGGFILALLIYAAWLAKPFIIPIASYIIFDIYNNWQKLLSELIMWSLMVAILFAGFYCYSQADKYGDLTLVGRIIKSRVFNADGVIPDHKLLFISVFYFCIEFLILFSFAAAELGRPFNYNDAIFFGVIIIGLFLSAFFVFKK
jgi:hypothetical protein